MSIRIYNPDELPFGLLSNNFNYKMNIDGEEWDNVSQYIYTNLIPIENKNFRDILRKIPYDQISNKYLEIESNIKDNFVRDILIKSLEQRFEDEEKRKYLLNTGNSKMFYINENNLFFGTKESLIPKLKLFDYTESKNVLGHVFEEIRHRIRMQIIETDLLKQYIKLCLLNETIMDSYSKIIDLMTTLHDKTNENKQLLFDGFIKQFSLNSIDIDIDEYKKEIENEPNLLKVLIISKKNPSCLVLYALHKTIRKSNEKLKKQLSLKIFEIYLNYFSKTNNVNRADIDEELKFLKKDYLEKIIFSLYEKKILPTVLNNEISQFLKNHEYLNEEALKSYDNFNYKSYINDNEIFNDLVITEPSKKDFLFTDSNEILSIFGKETLILEGRTYSEVDQYIQEKIRQNDFFNNDKRFEKIKKLCLAGLNAKYKFENYLGVLDRNTMDLHHILYLAKDKNIIQLDEISLISSITSGYLDYHSKNSINMENIISKYNDDGYDLDDFLYNDLFVNTWFMNIIKNFSILVSNMFFFIEKKINENIRIDSNFVKNVYLNFYSRNEDAVNYTKIPDYVSDKLNSYLEILNDKIIDEESVKKCVWEMFYKDLVFIWKSIGNESKQNDFKNIIYNIQLNLSESQSQFIILDDIIDNSICLAAINLLIKINEFSNDYLSVEKIYNKYYNNFKALNIEKFQYRNIIDLIKEISEKKDLGSRNLLGNILFEKSNTNLSIKNEDLINVFGIITNMNTYSKPVDVQNEKIVDYDYHDEYEEGIIQDYENEDDEFIIDVVDKKTSRNEDDDDEEEDKEKEDELVDEDDLNNEFEEAMNEMYNEDKEDDDYDGNFDQNRMKNEIDNFLKKQSITNIKSDLLIYLIDIIKNHSKTYIKSDAILRNRCNFFQYIPKNQKTTKKKNDIAKVEEKSSEENIFKDLKNVTGAKGGGTASETWIFELSNNKKMFGKFFININNAVSNLVFDDETKKMNFFLSSKSLEYEKRIYKDIIGPMKKLKICKHFVQLIDVVECNYEKLLNILIGHVNDSNTKKPFDRNKLDYLLKRNINGIINLDKKFKINEDSSENEIVSNSDSIENLSFTIILTKYFDFENNITTLTKFLGKFMGNKDVILQVLFQLAVVCYAISLCNMTHNDLHADNVFVKKLDSMQTFIYYINDKKFEIKTLFKVYVFDFNFSYVEKFGVNDGVNDYLCEYFSVCNEFVENKDILKILCAFFKFHPESLKYASSSIEKQKIIEEVYSEDKECFFRTKSTMGKSVRSDFFKQFNSSLNILKMIYIDIPKNDVETFKTSEQTIKKFLDGTVPITDSAIENISIIKEKNFNDGVIDEQKQVQSVYEAFSNDIEINKQLDDSITKEKEQYEEDFQGQKVQEVQEEQKVQEVQEEQKEEVKEEQEEQKEQKEEVKEEQKVQEEVKEEQKVQEEVKEEQKAQEEVKEEQKAQEEVKEEQKEEQKEEAKEEAKEEEKKEDESTLIISSEKEEFGINKKNMIKLFENDYAIFKGNKTNQLDRYFLEQVEFKNNEEKNTTFSIYSADCKHPSSFHHKELRKIRMNIYNDFIDKFRLYFREMNFQMLFDCLFFISKKSVYVNCDFSSDYPKNDFLVFRGFINLNESGDQYFYFKKNGSDEIFKEIIFPKHIVLYNTKNIKECDFAIVNDNEIDYRLYFGFQLSKKENDFFKKNLEYIETQSTPKILNGTIPELYTDDEMKKWSVKLKQYSKKFKKSFLNENNIVHKNLSLKEASDKNSTITLNPYTDEEKLIHKYVTL